MRRGGIFWSNQSDELDMVAKGDWNTEQERKKLKNEAERNRRDIKVLKGFCSYSGCKVKTKSYYCPKHVEQTLKNNKRRRDEKRTKIIEYEAAMILLADFKGNTLIEKARSARNYMDTVEGAML